MKEKIIRRLLSLILMIAFWGSEIFKAGICNEENILLKLQNKYLPWKREIKDIVASEVIELTSVTMEGKFMQKGEKIRFESNMGKLKIVKFSFNIGIDLFNTIMIYDGKNAWIVSPILGKKEISSEKSKDYQSRTDWIKSVFNPTAKITGIESVDGYPCYVLLPKPDTYPDDKLYFDRENFNLRKISVTSSKNDIVILLSDFRKFYKDIEIAYHFEIYNDEKLVATVSVTDLKVNQGLSDSLFDINNIEVEEVNLFKELEKFLKPIDIF